jgi:hypothetical protein
MLTYLMYFVSLARNLLIQRISTLFFILLHSSFLDVFAMRYLFLQLKYICGPQIFQLHFFAISAARIVPELDLGVHGRSLRSHRGLHGWRTVQVSCRIFILQTEKKNLAGEASCRLFYITN